jgi:alpha-L-rhamnosidase
MSRAAVVGLRAEYRSDSSWVGVPAPRLSWRTETEARNWVQAAAEIEVERGDQTSTSRVEGRDSVFVEWPFDPLAPRETVSIRVRVTGNDGVTSEWSAPLTVRAGFLADDEWAAAMIGSPTQATGKPALVRSAFTLDGEVARATLYATAHGVYQVVINGEAVDDEILKPGWTSYQWRLVHETTDVTALLRRGENVVGVDLAGGWYTERFGLSAGATEFYGTRPAVAVQILVEFADGRTRLVMTDGSWRVCDDGPRTASGIYQGEEYDARRILPHWSAPGSDAGTWRPVRVEGDPHPVPRPRTGPAVRATQELAVAQVLVTPGGSTVVDFGQNLVGRLRIRVAGPRGTVVTLRHAEVLEHGELGTRPLREAAATDRYTLAGDGPEMWEPQFTFHGFRYAQIGGWPGEFDPAAVTAVVVQSDLERSGWFDSSHELVNRLHENVVWGMRGNFLSIPSDCPQRSERLGWTGDIQVFAPTASFLYDSDGFLASWLEDVWLEQQHAGGVVPWVVPNVLGPRSAAGWGDATTIVPSVVYERFADRALLRRAFAGMTAWSDHIIARAGDRLLWEDDFQFGDWLDPDAPPQRPDKAKTAYLFRSVEITGRTARLIGTDAEGDYYEDLARRIRGAFIAAYTTPAGRMMSDAPTAYAIAITFGLFADEAQKQAFGERLAFLVRANGYRIGTGFLGTPLVEDALADTGHADTAGRLLLQTENPSWLYPVTMGATTIWERWDSMLEDGSINPGTMTSFNHYALGAVADWLHRGLAGLAPAQPGYRAIDISPTPLPGFDHASARHRTPYGDAEAGWRRDGTRVIIHATVPPNTSAVVTLPDGVIHEVGSGRHHWTTEAGVAASPSPVDLDSSLAALIDDREAYDVVVAAIDEMHDGGAADFRAHTRWTPGKSLRDALFFRYTSHTRDAIESALADLSARRR